MRVNVTYSVDLSEVKQIVEEILSRVEENIKDLNKNFPHAKTFLQEENEKKAAEVIETCRKSLSDAAYSLYDCQNILTGYQQAALQAAQSSPNTQADTEGESYVEGG